MYKNILAPNRISLGENNLTKYMVVVYIIESRP